MLVSEAGWFRALVRMRATELTKVGLRLLPFLIVSLGVSAAHEFGALDTTLSPLPFQLVALPLGVYLAFRGNRAHDRYWEARIQWGNLVNATRTFARQAVHLIAPAGEAEEFERDLVHTVIAFTYALRAHLSGQQPPLQAAAAFVPIEGLSEERNVPQALLRRVTPRLAAAHADGRLHAMHLPEIELAVTRMTDIQGACERIKATPLPVPITELTHRLVALYCLGLPFGIVTTLGWWTPVVVLFIGYAFIGFEATVEEIESPFAPGVNQLPLLTLCRTIETNLRQTIHETELPSIPVAEAGVLS